MSPSSSLLFPTLVLSLLLVLPSPHSQVDASPTAVQNVNFSPAQLPRSHDFRRAHSYPTDYFLSPRDGWQSISATDLAYKYPNSTHPASVDRRSPAPLTNESKMQETLALSTFKEGQALMKRKAKKGKKGGKSSKSKSKPKAADVADVSDTKNLLGVGGDASQQTSDDPAGGLLGGITGEVMKAVGKMQEVIITWYTGHDLLNPSCWANGDWAPTDQSFACALTMEGWEDRPACFKFLELCNGPSKCVFVRIVDTCAGCAVGSKHVDLTQAAFSSLADLDQGKLTDIQMRMATDPSEDAWDESLWGPRVISQ